ncbi:DNA helicase RecQ [Dethiosulfatarculus sandiegensis]|uniref:DNA helicase RecQ n=1 Tax=Dethiosulfatarculus sandiegensis TaxID=1429043 RepID=A0A0D2G849_9BACT|nr:DNA helicase RecQ [Dethiosulfatarculus sandiegensis]KIX11122.1 ATP-dependent DNA helicase RecQ [Dethiosulfatarculus sandiegensis]
MGPLDSRLPEEVLQNVFGFESFRGQQAEIIDHVLKGGDALVLMPTGGGKSLCYQVPALCRPGVGVVISPLIALMADQVQALNQYGVKAAALNSSLERDEAREVVQAMAQGELDLVYLSPERLSSQGFLDFLGTCPLALFAIDEAHCVSQWGHDFRPEYQKLNILSRMFPQVPRLALTATADEPTRLDMVQGLELMEPRLFISGFDRPNIQYSVKAKLNQRKQLADFLAGRSPRDSGIVYCISRDKVERTAEWLNQLGYKALPYHAGLDKEVRRANQDRFFKEEGIIITATIAFGMGIDKPDVRFVAHLDLPKSLEAYYQETGRAGRDGLPSEAWMVYGLEDVVKQKMFIENSNAAEKQKRIERQKLDALLGFCETVRCRRQVLLEYFGDTCEPCGNCDTCREPVESFDGTEAAQKALSCVYRTGQRFGANHVVDVLLGSDNQRVRDLGHNNLSTWGIGKEHSRNGWRSILRQLTSLGLLSVDVAGHGGLRLGPESRAVLRGEKEIRLRKEVLTPRKSPSSGGSRAKALFDDPSDEELFSSLRSLRMELAKEQGVPPYIIFHDSTLVEITREKPRNKKELSLLSGVGQTKLKRYGRAFLQAVKESLS